jgi:hypothetical protein
MPAAAAMSLMPAAAVLRLCWLHAPRPPDGCARLAVAISFLHVALRCEDVLQPAKMDESLLLNKRTVQSK